MRLALLAAVVRSTPSLPGSRGVPLPAPCSQFSPVRLGNKQSCKQALLQIITFLGGSFPGQIIRTADGDSKDLSYLITCTFCQIILLIPSASEVAVLISCSIKVSRGGLLKRLPWLGSSHTVHSLKPSSFVCLLYAQKSLLMSWFPEEVVTVFVKAVDNLLLYRH